MLEISDGFGEAVVQTGCEEPADDWAWIGEVGGQVFHFLVWIRGEGDEFAAFADGDDFVGQVCQWDGFLAHDIQELFCIAVGELQQEFCNVVGEGEGVGVLAIVKDPKGIVGKGVFDELDDGVNQAMKGKEYYVPLTNFVYIGDSDTDIPCMTLMSQFGGLAVGVYDEKTSGVKKVEKLVKEGRIKAAVKADYSENSDIEKVIKEAIINISKK